MTDIHEDMTAFVRRVPAGGTPHEFLDQQIEAGEVSALQLLEERSILMTEGDITRASAYISLGYFTKLSDEQKLAAWILSLEMAQMHCEEMLRLRFERYSDKHVLFQALPSLLAGARDGELVPYISSAHVRHDGVINWDGVFVRLDRYLPPALVANLVGAFPSNALYVRLEPCFATKERPREYLTEEVVVPADPNWWKTLGIHRGEAKGSQYCLQDPESPTINLQSFLEYRMRGVRTLEVHAQRTKDEYLSMMVEELVDLRETSGFVLGRCIHWDTEALMGTPPEAALVKHLDLAINVYIGTAAAQRLSKSLSAGRVTDATFRTHLLRIEGIPVRALLAISAQFFISRVLLDDWFQDQFRMLRPKSDSG